MVQNYSGVSLDRGMAAHQLHTHNAPGNRTLATALFVACALLTPCTDGLSSITSWIDGFGTWGAYPEPCNRNGGHYCQVAYVRWRSIHTLCFKLHVTGATLADITCVYSMQQHFTADSPTAWYVLSPLQPLWCFPTDFIPPTPQVLLCLPCMLLYDGACLTLLAWSVLIMNYESYCYYIILY